MFLSFTVLFISFTEMAQKKNVISSLQDDEGDDRNSLMPKTGGELVCRNSPETREFTEHCLPLSRLLREPIEIQFSSVILSLFL